MSPESWDVCTVKLMCAGAAVFTVSLIISVAFIGRSAATLGLAGRSRPLPVAITVGIVGGLVVIALWPWMARANSQGQNWARILSTVLFGLATLKLIGVFSEPRTVLGLIFWGPRPGGPTRKAASKTVMRSDRPMKRRLRRSSGCQRAGLCSTA